MSIELVSAPSNLDSPNNLDSATAPAPAAAGSADQAACVAGAQRAVAQAAVSAAGGAGADEALRRRLAWVYLSRVVQGPCAALSALIEGVGVEAAARAVRERDLPEVLRGPTEKRRAVDRAHRDLALMDRLGGRVVTPDDAEWPGWRMLSLQQLAVSQEPHAAPPVVTWARGPLSLQKCTEHAVAVVGSRASSHYGDRVTAELVGELVSQGWTIISGAAFGIDGAAHRAALAAGGRTVAVLGCGVDRAYPAEHERLLAEIAETGLIVSEYPPGISAFKHHFLARNRLIAALADGVVVVEAGPRSGSRNTVKWARRLSRPALAIPGPVGAYTSVGCHRMIRQGEAQLVTGAADVIEEIGPLQLSLSGASSAANLSADETAVYAAISPSAPQQAAELAVTCGLPIAAVRAALPALELAGLVDSDSSGWFRTPVPAPVSDDVDDGANRQLVASLGCEPGARICGRDRR